MEFARREAKKMMIRASTSRSSEISALMLTFARAGRRDVRLKRGDPAIAGGAADEIAACRQAGISIEVVPGVSSAATPPPACSGLPTAPAEERVG